MSSKKTKKKPEQKSTVRQVSVHRSSPLVGWVALAIAIFAFLLYANTLGHGYVLDDFSVLKENFITKRGLEGIPEHFKHHSRHGYWNSPGELYRPFTMTMFSVEWALAPDQPWLNHLINVLLYALTGAVLFIFWAKLLSTPSAHPVLKPASYSLLLPLLATLFFVAHPVHVEVVANIKSRDEIVMFLLCITALFWLWKNLETGRVHWLALALASYTVALFSKENAVTFVAIVPLMMYFFTKTSLKRIGLMTLVFALPALVFVLVRKAVIGDLTNPGEVSVLDNILMGASGNPGARSATAFLLLGKYLWTLLFPHPLGSDFGYNQIPLTNWSDWRVLLALVAWSGMGVFGLIQLKKRSLWSFSILFFLINFSIFTNLLITIGTSYGDRLLYSASPGFALALAFFLVKVFKEEKKEKVTTASGLFTNKGLWLVAGGILLLYSLKTVTRNMDWQSSYSLYHADIGRSPNSAKLNFHYGLELVKKGQEKGVTEEEQKSWYSKAKATFKRAIDIYPSYHDAYGQLGLAFYREKDYEKALENYNLALKHKPNFPLVYSNMGIIFFERGDLAKAKECYENAVKYDPRFADALRNLGVVYAMEKNFTEAIKYFQQGLQYAPDDPALNRFLGQAFKDLGNEAAGLPYLRKAEQLEAAAAEK